MEQRLSVVTLGVSDVAASTSFYKRLGWRPSRKASNDRITFFQMGGADFGSLWSGRAGGGRDGSAPGTAGLAA